VKRLVWILLIVSACGRTADVPKTGAFEDVARTRGIAYTHASAETSEKALPEIMGGGCGLVDVDGDGRLDVVAVGSAPTAGYPQRHALWIQRPDGRFSDVSASLPSFDAYGMGIVSADFDLDGDVDFVVTGVGKTALWRNRGDGVFEDVTPNSGIVACPWGTSGAAGDLDGDGDFDLVIGDYLDWKDTPRFTRRVCRAADGTRDYCSPQSYGAPGMTRVFENLGGLRFADRTESSGIGTRRGTALGVLLTDADGDGRIDVYVSNDQMPSFLWRNLGGWRFVEEATERGCAVDETGKSQAGMGVDGGDVNGDGRLDLWKVHLHRETHALYLGGNGLFLDATARTGLGVLTRSQTGFGTAIVDVDRDGRLDLLVANGRVALVPELVGGPDVFGEPDQWLRQREDGRFEEADAGAEFRLQEAGRGLAVGDIDDDGAIDVLVMNRDGPLRLFRNRLPAAAAWVGLRVRERSGADALGARVTLRFEDGESVSEVRAAKSYLATCDPRLQFTFARTRVPKSVHVRWTDGSETTFPAPAVGRWSDVRRAPR
jgi:hypothetical protein